MTNIIKRFESFTNDEILNREKEKISELEGTDEKDILLNKYTGLNKGIAELIYLNTESISSSTNSNYLESIRSKNIAEMNIKGFISDTDIFEFYLKFKTEIDEVLTNTNYYTKSPSENNLFSLYSIVLDGTKRAFKYYLKSFKL